MTVASEKPSPGEQERLAELRRYEILDTAPAASFDFLTRLAAYVFHAPIAVISLVDANRLWFKSKHGLAVAETPRDASFCSQAILGNDVFVVRDASSDKRFASYTLVAGPAHVRSYAGAPLHSPNGYNLGTLCIMDPNPRDVSEEERNVLAGLSTIVVDEFELRLKISDLDDEAYRLRAAEEAAQKALAHFEEAEYNLIAERVAREMNNIAARSLQRTAVPSPWPGPPDDK